MKIELILDSEDLTILREGFDPENEVWTDNSELWPSDVANMLRSILDAWEQDH